MNIKELTNQLYELSVGGYFNGEKFTKERLITYITNMFKTGNRLVMNIALPDGRWYFKITKFANDEYDYIIPDTREQEQKIKDIIGV
jgi:hypothetical protein